MAANPKPAPSDYVASPLPSATILPLNRVDRNGYRLIDQAAGGRLGAARGLVVGLSLGVLLWAGIVGVVWRVLH